MRSQFQRAVKSAAVSHDRRISVEALTWLNVFPTLGMLSYMSFVGSFSGLFDLREIEDAALTVLLNIEMTEDLLPVLLSVLPFDSARRSYTWGFPLKVHNFRSLKFEVFCNLIRKNSEELYSQYVSGRQLTLVLCFCSDVRNV